MQRLLDGQPTRSTDGLTILQLAVEANVKRWVLTPQAPPGLEDEFNHRKQHTNGITTASQHLHARVIDVEAANTALRQHNRELTERVEVDAQVIQELRTQTDQQGLQVDNNNVRNPPHGNSSSMAQPSQT